MKQAATTRDEAELQTFLGQTERSGTRRRAVMLHTDRLPPDLGRPHHVRLAREALASLAAADRARTFELADGRLVIVWRSQGSDALARAREGLEHLLMGQPEGKAPLLGELLTLYDLPEQAAWLLDEIGPADPKPQRQLPARALDAHQLACLEASLGQADLARFVRWRPVMRLEAAAPSLAWEERYFAVHDIAASLCPEFSIKADPWLFARLTRTLDRRMLSLLTSPREMRGRGTFALHIHIDTILAAEFLAFDSALPLALRGEVILNLSLTDILADPPGYMFARRFAQARGYRLALRGATLVGLSCLNLHDLALDFIHLACTPEITRMTGLASLGMPPSTRLIGGGLDRPSLVRWASGCGFAFGHGAALSR